MRVHLIALAGIASALACASGGGEADSDAAGSSSAGVGSGGAVGAASSSNGAGVGATASTASGAGGTTSSSSTSASGGGATSSSAGGVGGMGLGGMGGGMMTVGAGGGSGDLWIEITYGSNSTPTSPSWDNSATPGWTLQDWSTSNATWPEVWDPLQGMHTNLDPMGYWAAIIDGEHLQLMFGLEQLTSYTDAIVRLEGRGYSTNASAQIDVYNPLNNCGVSTSMAHDWSLHVVDVSIGSCLVPGGGVQAIRVDPTSQGLALHRMRLTIVGAVF